MIILLTNRNLDETNGSIKLGNKISNDQNHPLRLIHAVPSEEIKKIETYEDEIEYDTSINWKLTATTAGDEASKLKEISEDYFNNDKPWVFFVHGNNQTPEKNLDKCYLLSKLHNVNVLAFSWPSSPPVPFLNDKQKITVLLDLLQKPTLANLGTEVVKAFVKQKKESYKIARENAVKSVNDLHNALQLAEKNLFNKIPASINLLVHSLGCYLFKLYIAKHSEDSANLNFYNVILHQGDAEHEDHDQWINRSIIKCCKQQLTVTHNRRDSILLLSELEKFSSELPNNESSYRRLGRGKSRHISETAVYLDFTGGENVGLQHNFFLMEENKNTHIHQAMNRLLRCDPLDIPPPGFNEEKSNYFTVEQEVYEESDLLSDSEEF